MNKIVKSTIKSAIIFSAASFLGPVGSIACSAVSDEFINKLIDNSEEIITGALGNFFTESLKKFAPKEQVKTNQEQNLQRAVIASISRSLVKIKSTDEYNKIYNDPIYNEFDRDKISSFLNGCEEKFKCDKEYNCILTAAQIDTLFNKINSPLYDFSTIKENVLWESLRQLLFENEETEKEHLQLYKLFEKKLPEIFQDELQQIIKKPEYIKSWITLQYGLLTSIKNVLEDHKIEIQELKEAQRKEFENIQVSINSELMKLDIIIESNITVKNELEKMGKILKEIENWFKDKGKPKNIRQLLIENSRLNHKKFHSAGMPFHDLIINEDIMPGLQIKSDEVIETEIKVNGELKVTLLEGIKKLWEKDIFHTSVIGEGGMGKTVSLLKLWNLFLEGSCSPIPIYIELNNYNAYYVKSENESLHNRNYIMNVITKNYLGIEKISDEDRNALSELLKKKNSQEGKHVPSIILLLDGLNEVTVTKKDLIYEINEFIKNYSGVQLIITSRYELKNMSQYMGYFNKIELLKLTDNQILNYLKNSNLEKPIDKTFDLLRNPMMLTIYSITCHMLKVNRNTKLILKDKVETYGELMWNYKEAQLMKSADIDEQFIKYSFVLNHVIPYLGFKMESMGKFELTREDLENSINEICERLHCKEFIKGYRMYSGKDTMKMLKLGKLDWPDEDDRFNEYMDINKSLDILYYTDENENIIKFTHQNFRDFFAACHVLNEIKINIVKNESMNENEMPQVLKEKPLSAYVRKCIGEIEGEHYNVPIIDRKNKMWSINHYKDTIITKELNNCRNIFDDNIGYTVSNLVEILKSVRMDFTGMNLSYLDLRKCLLNGVRFSRWYGNIITNTNFDGSLIDMKIFINHGHKDAITSAVYSPDGKYIVSASWDNTLKEWNKETGMCIRTYVGHENTVTSSVYSPDGKYIISASWDNTLREWNRETGNCIRTYVGHENFVTSAIYSPDGKYIISASRDNTLKEWSRETGTCVRTYEGHGNAVTNAVYSPDGKYIISASWDSTLKEWDRDTGVCIRTYKGHKNFVTGSVYSPDGKYIISASWNKTLKEWDRETGTCIKTYVGHLDNVENAVYSPDGKYIISASWDKTLKEWDRNTGMCIRTYVGHKNFVTSAIYSLDGKYIISASWDKTLKEWDRDTGTCIKKYEGYVDNVENAVYSPDGKYILSTSWDDTLKEWDRDTGICIRSYVGHESTVTSATYSPDGKYIISASWDNTLKEWDRDTGMCIRTYEGHENIVTSAVYSPDGKYILSTSWDDTLKEWDRETGNCIKTYKGHVGNVENAVYSPDGKYIISASRDNTLKEWDRDTGMCIRTYVGHENIVTSAVYSPDGKYILSTSWDDTLKEWDKETGICISTYVGHENIVTSAVYSPDGKYIISASCDNTLKEWDRDTGMCIRTYEGHEDFVTSAVYSADCKYIISASLDGTLKEWYKENPLYSKTIKYRSGLLITNCTFKNMNPKSNLTNEEKEILKQYGAVF
ncbi:MAG: hypothetical protein ABRQ25_14775 [Clostridiaceae bacterium]